MFWWLSFADSKRPAGEQNLGVTMVVAESLHEATIKTHRLGINPGGEIKAVRIVDDGTIDQELLVFTLNTLRSVTEMRARFSMENWV